MAWVLVKWLTKDFFGVVPSECVVRPTPLPLCGFPIHGFCYWKKKTKACELLAVSGLFVLLHLLNVYYCSYTFRYDRNKKCFFFLLGGGGGGGGGYS